MVLLGNFPKCLKSLKKYLKKSVCSILVGIFFFVCIPPIPTVFAKCSILRKVNMTSKEVAITFDDGPSLTYTPQILKLLKQYQAHATFFVIGERIIPYQKLVVSEWQAGNEFGNHTYHHILLTGRTENQISQELSLTEKAMHQVIPQTGKLKWFRPTRGRSNAKVCSIAQQMGYRTVLWSIDSSDWQNPSPEKMAQRILEQIRPGDILLFHDQGGNRTSTIRALRIVLYGLHNENYKVVTLSQLYTDKEKGDQK
ncbi:Peptidoglycan/xylan/chitin deacetylase, PgdA/CDA1 family [Alicyclobacillus tolerans]|uniref:Peptidoglycan/xylan/chitin deacetylase, PgdA/CDA1 family n=2 Tax=Alicyclobacillus tolerans TaxID=90970 RepID=A0A1M6W757_9BACL|nr:Peptidoglycan/xylan/chitin deacetylase, PgdA/CDA1 family [Alicyclobacillus montanus]